jgi:uncharacterized membrane protein YeaQ/YmgE (transglycosylase-associated protein family)
MHFLVWIVVSGFAGFVASKLINKSGSGLLMDIVLGIVGGFVGGFIVSRVPALGALAVEQHRRRNRCRDPGRHAGHISL